jgi:hypothetical protein
MRQSFISHILSINEAKLYLAYPVLNEPKPQNAALLIQTNENGTTAVALFFSIHHT